jgi:hypothetical protein
MDTTSKGNVIHMRDLKSRAPKAVCGRMEVPVPCAAEWRYVDCPKCLALKTEVDARRK